ncbi:TVP38/TMEM64 family protein [Salisediminibacterium halotolerans]|uniref:TVP38/TMEM64 family protein n=1 Tax=Salisediminibacterium halotolerans TaxID=517425 RepID=UPI000F2044B7|nr:VTT domain-containing protein [Salisediminibacterium halotolerans]RLJ80853.1 putative membrane protein YdjX (TVP38/TMEM64 family) [Actinophytocola xinjiangensis]RPE84048.1 putative membrane protein YdjX (TVP38/TMEM64 family) [Salisediminibacterium halotolerans]TWG37800.1 putative membrane protein YdjX (TVP38/TMEM64 family) [Salisediminibacterium halotolerans]GEL08552.1 hypothetical protein SHA02_19680 [Salisediminibacterium halotolerans]
MDEMNQSLLQFVDEAGWLAPVIFILLHVFRPLLMLPIIVLYISGGFFFGFIQGTVYTMTGLALMNALFYFFIMKFPRFRAYLRKLKKSVFNDRKMTIGQVNILRMMPFIHFQLLSMYLLEMTSSFREFMQYSVYGVIAPSVIYTAFGGVLTDMPWYVSGSFFAVLLFIFWLFGKEGEYHQRIPGWFNRWQDAMAARFR